MAINLTFPMRRGPNGFSGNSTTIDAVKDDLRILLLSNPGGRGIHGDFGAGLRRIIFEPESGILEKAEDLILAAIEKWMPFVKVIDLQVFDSTTDRTVRQNEIRISLKFEVSQIEGVLEQRIRN